MLIHVPGGHIHTWLILMPVFRFHGVCRRTHLFLVEVWQDEASTCQQLGLGVRFVIRTRLHVP